MDAADLRTPSDRGAERNGGSSSNSVYDAVEQVILSRGLSGSVLDYGAGAGKLTRRLIACGRFGAITAADLAPKPDGMEAVRWIEQDLNDALDVGGETFDLIIAAGVIEYLEDPGFTMREIARLLRPGGTAIVTTPNHASWRSRISYALRGRHAAFDPKTNPAAIVALLREDFARIAAEAKLSPPSFFFSRRGGLPGMPARSWQQISFGLLHGVRFSDDLIAVATKAQMPPA